MSNGSKSLLERVSDVPPLTGESVSSSTREQGEIKEDHPTVPSLPARPSVSYRDRYDRPRDYSTYDDRRRPADPRDDVYVAPPRSSRPPPRRDWREDRGSWRERDDRDRFSYGRGRGGYSSRPGERAWERRRDPWEDRRPNDTYVSSSSRRGKLRFNLRKGQGSDENEIYKIFEHVLHDARLHILHLVIGVLLLQAIEDAPLHHTLFRQEIMIGEGAVGPLKKRLEDDNFKGMAAMIRIRTRIAIAAGTIACKVVEGNEIDRLPPNHKNIGCSADGGLPVQNRTCKKEREVNLPHHVAWRSCRNKH